MLNTDTLFFFKGTITEINIHHLNRKHCLKQREPHSPFWLRDALGKIHPNAGGFTSHWIFFLSFHKLSFPTVQIATAWWYPPPYKQFQVPFTATPACSRWRIRSKSPGQHHPCEAVSPFSNPTAQLCSRRQLGTNHIIPIRIKSTNILWSCSNIVSGFKQAA